MKLLIKIALVAILTLLLGPYYHFWAAAVIAIVTNYIIRTGSWSSFLSGFLGVGITWYFYALYLYSDGSENIARMIAEIFGMHPQLLFAIAAVLGGLVGGLGGVVARSFYQLFDKKKYTPYH